MDVKTAEAFVEVIRYLCESFGIAVDWSGENVLPYLNTLMNKIVTYEYSVAIMWIVAGVVVGIIVGLILTIWGYKDDGEGRVICGVILIVIGVIVIMYNANTAITCKTFPEKVTYEFIKNYDFGLDMD